VGVGTDLALSIGHNLLMLTKYCGKGTYLDFCDREVRKVMQAPPEIQESILSPLHRPDKADPYPGYGARRHPSNPRNTLRGLPTLDPEAVFERGQICNRCEKDAGVVNIFGAGLRPVTNLGKGPGKFYWEGLPLNKHTGKAESKAFLCPGCVFPACAHIQPRTPGLGIRERAVSGYKCLTQPNSAPNPSPGRKPRRDGGTEARARVGRLKRRLGLHPAQ